MRTYNCMHFYLQQLHEIAITQLHHNYQVFVVILNAWIDIEDAQQSLAIGLGECLHNHDLTYCCLELRILITLIIVTNEFECVLFACLLIKRGKHLPECPSSNFLDQVGTHTCLMSKISQL